MIRRRTKIEPEEERECIQVGFKASRIPSSNLSMCVVGSAFFLSYRKVIVVKFLSERRINNVD